MTDEMGLLKETGINSKLSLSYGVLEKKVAPYLEHFHCNKRVIKLKTTKHPQ